MKITQNFRTGREKKSRGIYLNLWEWQRGESEKIKSNMVMAEMFEGKVGN